MAAQAPNSWGTSGWARFACLCFDAVLLVHCCPHCDGCGVIVTLLSLTIHTVPMPMCIVSLCLCVCVCMFVCVCVRAPFV